MLNPAVRELQETIRKIQGTEAWYAYSKLFEDKNSALSTTESIVAWPGPACSYFSSITHSNRILKMTIWRTFPVTLGLFVGQTLSKTYTGKA